LYEYEAKRILTTFGIPTPRGEVTANPAEARKAADNLKAQFAVKAQVLVAGRGKAGGILFAENTEQVAAAAERLLGMKIRDSPVKSILVEERIPITRELYFSVTVDRAERKYALLASTLGGMDIEEAATKNAEAVVKTLINLDEGVTDSSALQIAGRMGYSGRQSARLASVLVGLWHAGQAYDAELIETNPLVETTNGEFVAVDARLIVDDNALFRHPELERLRFAEERENTLSEVEAARSGLAYIKLGGNVGLVGNGAGLVMATLDTIQYYGGAPADFLDLGGGAPVERIAKALEIVLSDPSVKAVLINILGGLTHCDDVARAITQIKKAAPAVKPLVVRLVGTNEEEGRRILIESDVVVLDSMEEAAKHAVEAAEEAR